MAELIRDHSPAYWLHLYRRIAPTLTKRHDNKTDDNTVALVRQTAELAYLKHGDVSRRGDLGHVLQTRLETFLGGHYYAAVSERLCSKLKARQQYERLRKSSQSVMLDFSEDELYRAFEVEGLAYEYWRASAAMRTVGKGTAVAWNGETAWFTYAEDEVHPLLFEVYDARIRSARGLHTSLGTWTELGDRRENGRMFFFAAYNPHPKPERFPAWDPSQRRITKTIAAVNFHMGSGSLDRFAAAHAFMADAFMARHGVKLEAVLFCVWAASFFAVFPERLFFMSESSAKKAALFSNFTNLSQRGYALTRLRASALAEEALWWARAAGHESALTPDEVAAGFRFMLLDGAAQDLIGLWSGGKRPLLLLQDDKVVVDLAGVIPFLMNLFFGVREETGAKGTVFEQGVRDALEKEGLSLVQFGELVWNDGRIREVDAAVRLGNRLILVECFSFERPLDFELAKPGVFEVRKQRLAEKIKQARTLCEAVLAEPVGKNFDFSWAGSVEWRLASPFVEFAWTLGQEQFDENGVARILQVEELLDYLADGERPGGEIAGLVPRLRGELN